MSWFSEQLKNRMKKDKEDFENSFVELSSVVLGETAIARAINNDRKKTQNAIEEVLKFYNAKIVELPNKLDDMNEQLEYMLRPTGIMRRAVELKGKWWKNAVGAFIGQTKSGDTVALIPDATKGYSFFDCESGHRIKISNKTKGLLEESAFCFYKPFPLRKLTLTDIGRYIISALSGTDILYIAFFSITAQLIGMILPFVNKLLFGSIIPVGKVSLLLPFAVLLIGMTLSQALIKIANQLVSSRIGMKMNVSIQAATMSRIMSLPASFFSKYNSGDLSSRVEGMQQIALMLSSLFFGVGLSTLCSFVYIFQMNQYASPLVVPALSFILIQLGLDVIGTFRLLSLNRKKNKFRISLNSLIYSLFSGVQKIKLSGAERRAFSKWANTYKSAAKLDYQPPTLIKVLPVISKVISMSGSIVLYYIAGTTDVSLSDFIAFNTAFSAVSGAILALSPVFTKFAEMKPFIEIIQPILDTEPEISENKKIITDLAGAIELNNVSFRYSEKGSLVLDNVSLKIDPGQYIAIVGKTGCGKSTLMRLLLGFESTKNGAIYYDGQDINTLDLRSLRRHIGAVMQNGKLFQGDIFSNIVISAPWLTLDDAWEAARLAGIEADIKDMPMGMHTVITEGSGGVSGGQKQRLMIARAIAPRPSILMFDEATSALDNITQKQISDSLDSLKSTRIVIAHRLSTIKNCDRIVVIDGGKIIEDGTFAGLMNQNGFFAELVKRQQINKEAN